MNGCLFITTACTTAFDVWSSAWPSSPTGRRAGVPNSSAMSYGAARVKFRFPIIKLRDYEKRWPELQESDNPFAVIVMSHLKTQQTKRDDVSRYGWKLKLIRGLLRKAILQRMMFVSSFRFIDWLMRLPEGLEDSLWQELHRFEEENRMPYVTSVERIGMQRGLQQGLMTAIKLGLKLKFGDEGLQLFARNLRP